MKKIKQTAILLTMILSLCGSFFVAGNVMAAQCAGVDTSIVDCDQTGSTCPEGETLNATTNKCSDGSNPIENSGVWGILILVINILSGGIAIVAIGGIAYGAILYASAGGSVEKVKTAVKVMMNVILGAVMYAIAYSLLNWLIPGGAF